jgi:hypothetical protein
LLAGRDIDGRDTATGVRVVVVNQTFADRFYPGMDAVGETVQFSLAPAGPRTIIGIVGDAVLASPAEPPIPAAYEPLAQWGSGRDLPKEIRISVRSAAGPPTSLMPGIRAALSAIEPDLSYSFQPLAAQVSASLARNRLLAWLSGFFGILALLLAGVGLYGVTAYGASQRRREVGIRMALGSGRRRVVRLMLSRAMRLVISGIVLGSVASIWLSRFVAGLVYGVDPSAPGTLLAATTVLACVGAFGAWLPAYRASRIDPWIVLRDQ